MQSNRRGSRLASSNFGKETQAVLASPCPNTRTKHGSIDEKRSVRQTAKSPYVETAYPSRMQLWFTQLLHGNMLRLLSFAS
jgi:hypothetical protein